MKRYLIPALILVSAASEDHAAEVAGETIVSLHQRRHDDLSIRMCEASPTIELDAARQVEPSDLTDYLVSADTLTNVARSLEETQAELTAALAQLSSRTDELKRLHHAASVLCEECETNNDFGTQHADELDALENVSQLLSQIQLPE